MSIGEQSRQQQINGLLLTNNNVAHFCADAINGGGERA
jgi:hypothetical protein